MTTYEVARKANRGEIARQLDPAHIAGLGINLLQHPKCQVGKLATIVTQYRKLDLRRVITG